MIARSVQLFSILLALILADRNSAAELPAGSTLHLVFRDVDGNDLSTAAGHVTIITVVTRENEEKARAVAALVPDRYVGDPKFRYVTLVNFQRKIAGPLHGLTRAIIRKRLDAEATKLQPKYASKRLTRDPRSDVYVVADFDASAVTRLGLSPAANDVAVFLFAGNGKLVAQWTGVPPRDSLAAAIVAAEK